MRTLLLGGAAVAALLSTGAAVAAPAAAAGDVVRLDEVVVVAPRTEGYAAERTGAATRTATPLVDVPQSVSVISEDVIRDLSLQGMADLVRLVPGVSMAQGEGHRDAPTVRGVVSTADFFTDGVRDDVQRIRDLYNLERVEILKGPNAMIFGRGGGGGVINQVAKKADFVAAREATFEVGSDDHRRAVLDLNQPLGQTLAGRLTAVWQDSESYRDHVVVERRGVNPTATFAPESGRLVLRAGYERFEDERTVDRGVSSFRGRPLRTDPSLFFGDPDLSWSTYRGDTAFLSGQYVVSPAATLRSRTNVGDYDKFYANVFPGAVTASTADPAVPATVALAAYNNRTYRQNWFHSTDLVVESGRGGLDHTFLLGVEFGRQTTKNRRETGYFGPLGCGPVRGPTSIQRPVSDPTSFGTQVAFCQSASDGDVKSRADVAAVYVQDQIAVGPWRLIGGLRFDRFELQANNRRDGTVLSRSDDLVSPRLGLIYKPVEAASVYASWSVSHLPSSGEQFASLTPTLSSTEPEEFENLEVGAKWTPRPGLNLSAAVYRLDRTNTTATVTSGVIVQTGATRSEGLELEVAGRVTPWWEVIGGLAVQNAEITARTAAAGPGQKIPLVPEKSVSLWNKVAVTDAVSAGLGVIWQDEVFASIDNAVTLPAFARVDAALYWKATDRVSVQLNVENLLDEGYFATAHSNTNIMPGRPRSVRASLTTAF